MGEPVRAVADGVVQFAGMDLPGQVPARGLLPRQLRRFRARTMGPGGFFVRVLHADGIRSGYFHLTGFRVVAGQTVKAGEIIGTVGRSGIKVSGSHLHFEVHRDGELEDPVRFLAAFVLPPDRTITHELAMAEKHQRLARARRVRRHAREACRKRGPGRPGRPWLRDSKLRQASPAGRARRARGPAKGSRVDQPNTGRGRR